jgi:hypothetical protein
VFQQQREISQLSEISKSKKVSRKAEGSRPDEVNIYIFFNLPNPSSLTRSWGLLSLLQKRAEPEIYCFWRVERGPCVRLTTYHHRCGILNLSLPCRTPRPVRRIVLQLSEDVMKFSLWWSLLREVYVFLRGRNMRTALTTGRVTRHFVSLTGVVWPRDAKPARQVGGVRVQAPPACTAAPTHTKLAPRLKTLFNYHHHVSGLRDASRHLIRNYPCPLACHLCLCYIFTLKK